MDAVSSNMRHLEHQVEEPWLSADGVTKSFDGNVALRDFSLKVRQGEVHALVGHNGSGKSTFVKILAGFHVPDRGEVTVGGRQLEFGDPGSASRVGLSFVHQTLGLAPALSIVENLHLGQPYDTNAFGIIRRKKAFASAQEALSQWGLDLDPRTEVARLSAVERVEVALARALGTHQSVQVLVLDEPTAALGHSEVDRLFAAIERITRAGVSVIYISHHLEELQQIADSATVLRDGSIVAEGPMSGFDIPRLVRLISGAPVEERTSAAQAPGPAPDSSAVLLRITDLRDDILDGLDLEVRGGEMLGVFGLAGSGVEELVNQLAGRSVAKSGTIEIDGASAAFGDVAGLSRRGLRMIVGEKSDRVMAGLSVGENATQAVVGSYFKNGVLSLRGLASRARRVLRVFDVKPALPTLPAGSLSGGNQQKLALARVVQGQPAVLVLERPFEGVDVGARRELISLLRAECQEGRAVLLLDTNADELVDVCDTIVVLHEGAIALRISGASSNKHLILEASFGTN